MVFCFTRVYLTASCMVAIPFYIVVVACLFVCHIVCL